MNDQVYGPVEDAADQIAATVMASTYMAHNSLAQERAKRPDGGVRGAMISQIRGAKEDARLHREGMVDQADRVRQHIAGGILDAYDGLVGRQDRGSRLADVLDPTPTGVTAQRHMPYGGTWGHEDERARAQGLAR